MQIIPEKLYDFKCNVTYVLRIRDKPDFGSTYRFHRIKGLPSLIEPQTRRIATNMKVFSNKMTFRINSNEDHHNSSYTTAQDHKDSRLVQQLREHTPHTIHKSSQGTINIIAIIHP